MTTKFAKIAVCVFDAYGTLFDINSAARTAQDALGEKWPPLADLWRSKQLQYTWLRSLQGNYADFWQVTGDALDFALAMLRLEEDAPLRARLMDLYLNLNAYPEVLPTLRLLRSAGMKLAILSNGTPKMLASAASSAGITDLFDAILSVDQLRIYKPHGSVYELARKHFDVPAERICFISSNGWDACSAKAFGFRVAWCNRTNQPPEQIPETPDAQISSLVDLPSLVLSRRQLQRGFRSSAALLPLLRW